MTKKKKSWQEIKAGKSIEEWRRINKIYDQRRKLKNQLTLKGAELMKQIHNYRLIQSPGPADALLDEVRKALRLPYAWGQEDYDHATARLADIATNIRKLQLQITPRQSELANILMMTILNSGDSEEVKATALIGAVEYMANQLSLNKVVGLEMSKTNYLMTLLRTKDSYYPSWVPRYALDNLLQLLREEDLRRLLGWLQSAIATFDSRDSILRMINMQEEEETEIR